MHEKMPAFLKGAVLPFSGAVSLNHNCGILSRSSREMRCCEVIGLGLISRIGLTKADSQKEITGTLFLRTLHMMLEVGKTQRENNVRLVLCILGDLGEKDVGPETRYTWYDVPLMMVTVLHF